MYTSRFRRHLVNYPNFLAFRILWRSLARTLAEGTRVFKVSSFMHNSASPSTCSALGDKSKVLKRKIKVFKAKLSGLNTIRSKKVNVFRYFAPKVHFQLGTFVRWGIKRKMYQNTVLRIVGSCHSIWGFFSFKSRTYYLVRTGYYLTLKIIGKCLNTPPSSSTLEHLRK